MLGGNAESAIVVSDEQRKAVAKGILEGFSQYLPAPIVPFDANRGWTARLHILSVVAPHAKVICCVRHIDQIFAKL